MTSLQKLMHTLHPNDTDKDTRYEFHAISLVVWVMWNYKNILREMVFARCNNVEQATMTATMLDYAAFCQNCSSLDKCPRL